MKTFLITLLGIGLATSLPAQVPEDFPPPIQLTAPELDELLGPIALYPDALISIILPAATAPMDIVLAARFVASDGDLARVDEKSWEPSVRALTRYPETLSWLDENLEWTSQVGTAFIEQPVEVMESIQRLRGMARALGNLVDTPQQRIVVEETYIRIVPAQVDYIYEPRYDPYVVYYERPVSVPYLYFSVGFGVGSWLNYDCDWRRHRVYRGDWDGGWDYRRDRDRDDDRRDGRGDNIYINNNITNVQEWRPDPVRHRTQARSVATRISNDSNNTRRTPSLDQGTTDLRTADRKNSTDGRVPSNDRTVNESRKRHERVARPKAIAELTKYPEGIKRKEPNDRPQGGDTRGRVGNEAEAGKMKGKDTEADSKGRIAVPGSVAPGTTGEGKGKNKDDARDGGDRKKPGSESTVVTPGIATPPMKEGDAKGRAEIPDSKREEGARQKDAALKEELKRREESKRNEAPKREEAQKNQERVMPKPEAEPRDQPAKRVETPKREAPKQEEAGRKQEMPKRQDEPKKVETPKREEPKREAPKQEEARRKPEMPKPQEAPRKVEAPKREEPKRQEAPKQEEARKKQEMPKRPEIIRQDAPRKVEAPKRQEPKRQEAPKPQEPPKKQESPKRPESASREEPRKAQVKPAGPSEAGKAEEKKKDEEKKKKKQ